MCYIVDIPGCGTCENVFGKCWLGVTAYYLLKPNRTAMGYLSVLSAIPPVAKIPHLTTKGVEEDMAAICRTMCRFLGICKRLYNVYDYGKLLSRYTHSRTHNQKLKIQLKDLDPLRSPPGSVSGTISEGLTPGIRG
jgi:hypothetical protein